MPAWLGVLLAVVTIVAALSAIAGGAFISVQKGKNAELRADNDDLRNERADADRRAELAEHDRDRANAQLAKARTQVAALTEAVTQADAVKSLAKALDQHRHLVERNHARIDDNQEKLLRKADEALRLLRERQ